MAILEINEWEPWTCEVAPDVFIKMKLKRLKRHESRPLLKVILTAFGEADKTKADGLTSSQRAAIVAAAYEMLPEDELKRWFSDCVIDVEDFKINGQPIRTGAELLDRADDELIVKILMRLHALSKLSVSEGNASASRSTLQLVGGANGGSPVASTEREAGTSPSVVSATPEATPSTPPA